MANATGAEFADQVARYNQVVAGRFINIPVQLNNVGVGVIATGVKV